MLTKVCSPSDFSSDFCVAKNALKPSGSYAPCGHKLGAEGTLEPCGIAVDIHDNIYVADTSISRIQVFHAITAELWYTIGGPRPSDKDGEFDDPLSIAFGLEGELVVCDTGNNRFQVNNLPQTGNPPC